MRRGNPPLLLLVLCAAAAARRLTVVPQPALTDAETGAFTVNASVVVPRFDPGPKALDFLRREGYVVIRDVLNASDLALARRLFWAFVEGAGASSADPASWRRALSPNQYGIAWGLGAGQSRLMWHVRTRPRLLQMFALVWGTDDLLTSFEAFSLLPPREAEAGWSLAESWFHTDQNGRSRPGLQTVQSFTSLWPQDERSGAFVVVPRGLPQRLPGSLQEPSRRRVRGRASVARAARGADAARVRGAAGHVGRAAVPDGSVGRPPPRDAAPASPRALRRVERRGGTCPATRPSDTSAAVPF